MSAGRDRRKGDASLDQLAFAHDIAAPALGSILIVGDDALLVRALDRLLRRAGYTVGTEDRWTGDPGKGSQNVLGKEPILTIIDLPDHHVLDAAPERTSIDRAAEPRVLWIGTTPPAPERSSFLVKPFTAEEFLSRVKVLIGTQISTDPR